MRPSSVRIAATTAPEPAVGLVFYDLKTALRQISPEQEAKPAAKKRAPSKPKKDDAA